MTVVCSKESTKITIGAFASGLSEVQEVIMGDEASTKFLMPAFSSTEWPVPVSVLGNVQYENANAGKCPIFDLRVIDPELHDW